MATGSQVFTICFTRYFLIVVPVRGVGGVHGMAGMTMAMATL